MAVAAGDVVLAATDGVWDNVFPEEVAGVVDSAQRRGDAPDATAALVAQLALSRRAARARAAHVSRAAASGGGGAVRKILCWCTGGLPKFSGAVVLLHNSKASSCANKGSSFSGVCAHVVAAGLGTRNGICRGGESSSMGGRAGRRTSGTCRRSRTARRCRASSTWAASRTTSPSSSRT